MVIFESQEPKYVLHNMVGTILLSVYIDTSTNINTVKYKSLYIIIIICYAVKALKTKNRIDNMLLVVEILSTIGEISLYYYYRAV